MDIPQKVDPQKGNPVTDREFAALLDTIVPAGPVPRLAVALSGGGDSMALVRLAQIWCQNRGAALAALTVDHGLRSGSADDARQVGAWMVDLGIPHHILGWQGPKPRSAIQAKAREARYRLMTDWLRAHHDGPLLLAHQREDQAETFLLRLDKGSGLDGLAGMKAVGEMNTVAILRPLLSVPKARLLATLRVLGQDWLEDPSNRNPRFARNHMRQLIPLLFSGPDPALPLARLAGKLGGLRHRLDQAALRAMAETCHVDPAGFAMLAPEPLGALPDEILGRVLAQLVMGLGPRPYGPRRASLERAVKEIRRTDGGISLTLGGCVFSRRANGILLRREMRRPPPPMEAKAGSHEWDGIYRVWVGSMKGGAKGPLYIQRLGKEGWRQLAGDQPQLGETHIPPAVRPALAALFDAKGVFQVPHLAYKRKSEEKTGIGINDIEIIGRFGKIHHA